MVHAQSIVAMRLVWQSEAYIHACHGLGPARCGRKRADTMMAAGIA
ncbi:hypothetical protein HF289_09680 [Acidithiobacillus ferrooxidans]|nr:hypothetical protein [Acidithiobacillus ferrooxidans]